MYVATGLNVSFFLVVGNVCVRVAKPFAERDISFKLSYA